MSYASQQKKMQKKKARKEKAKKLTTKVQNTTRKPEKQLEKLEKQMINIHDKDIDSQLDNLTFQEFLEIFEEGYKKNLKLGKESNFTNIVENYIKEDIINNNIRIFNNFTYDGFLNIDMIKNTVSPSKMGSFLVLLTEVFDTVEAFVLMPLVIKINEEQGRKDLNLAYAMTINKNCNLEEDLTAVTVGAFIEDIADKIPEIFKLGIIKKPVNENDLRKLNEKFAELNGAEEEYKITTRLAHAHREKYKVKIENYFLSMTETYPNAVKNFKEKYVTNNLDLKFDLHSPTNTEKEIKDFVESFKQFLLATGLSEKKSTDMKLEYYHGGNKNLYKEIASEIGFNLEEFIDKSEYDLKHKIRELITPYGSVSQIFLQNDPVDKTAWRILFKDGYYVKDKDLEEDIEKGMTDPNYIHKAYNAFKEDLFSLKEFSKKITFEDLLTNKIDGFLDHCLYEIENYYSSSITEDPLLEQVHVPDFNKAAENVVREVNVKEYKKLFEKKGFEELLIKKVSAKLETYAPMIEHSIEHYKGLIEERIDLQNRVCTFLQRKVKDFGVYKESKENRLLHERPDSYNIEDFKKLYSQVIEILDLESSEEFKEIDFEVQSNIKIMEEYNKDKNGI